MYDQDRYEGQPTKILKGRQGMKKLFSALIAGAMLLAMGLSFAACGPQASGMFYSLEEAYEAGLLTQEELLSIAYYQNGGREGNEALMPEGYAPQKMEALDKKTERAICATYLSEHPRLEMKVSDLSVYDYCGTYGNCYAVKIGYLEQDVEHVLWQVTIGGVYFYNSVWDPVLIWTKDTN